MALLLFYFAMGFPQRGKKTFLAHTSARYRPWLAGEENKISSTVDEWIAMRLQGNAVR